MQTHLRCEQKTSSPMCNDRSAETRVSFQGQINSANVAQFQTCQIVYTCPIYLQVSYDWIKIKEDMLRTK